MEQTDYQLNMLNKLDELDIVVRSHFSNKTNQQNPEVLTAIQDQQQTSKSNLTAGLEIDGQNSFFARLAMRLFR